MYELPKDPSRRAQANSLLLALACVDRAIHKFAPTEHQPGETIGVAYHHPSGYHLLQEIGYVAAQEGDATILCPRVITRSGEDPGRFEAMIFGPRSVVSRRDSQGRITTGPDNLRQMAHRAEMVLSVIESAPDRSGWWVKTGKQIGTLDI